MEAIETLALHSLAETARVLLAAAALVTHNREPHFSRVHGPEGLVGTNLLLRAPQATSHHVCH